MKVSVITLHNIKNYGSVFQTYATQQIFSRLDCDVEFVDYYRKDIIGHNYEMECLKTSRFNKNLFLRLFFKLITKSSYRKQSKIFNSFLDQYIHLTAHKYFSMDDLLSDVPKADIYCTGSDQTWNSTWNQGIEYPFFLEYAPTDAECFSFSASIGKAEFEPWEMEETRKLLQKYSFISVREASAVKILNNLGFSNVIQILDPTLILAKDDWIKIESPRLISKQYVLIYQLNKNKAMDHFAKNLAKKNRCRLVRIILMHDQAIRKCGHAVWLPTPEEFLSLFHYADYIVTDSFHGTAFSINFEKQFSVFYPPKFSTRLQSILSLTKLENRVVRDPKDISLFDKTIDYGNVHEILLSERNKAHDFLNRVLTSKKEQKNV